MNLRNVPYDVDDSSCGNVSVYKSDFTPREFFAKDDTKFWKNKLAGEGQNIRIKQDDGGSCYLNNFTTLNDLNFNHFPRCLKPPVYKIWMRSTQKYEPKLDFSLNYGNLTNYGLLGQMKKKWKCERDKYTHTSEYKDSFGVPQLEKVEDTRYPRSMNMCVTNRLNLLGWRLRNELPTYPGTKGPFSYDFARKKKSSDVSARILTRKSPQQPDFITKIPYECVLGRKIC